MPGLLDVPVKVFEGHLFKYLDWNDHLRLRRVCKGTKEIVTEFLKTIPEKAPEIEINEKEKCFRAFLEMGISTTKLFINNPTSGHFFYEREKRSMKKFLENYGPSIEHLHVTRITLSNGAFCKDKEIEFMESLPNLKSLEIGYCTGYGEIIGDIQPGDPIDMEMLLDLPSTFLNLEVIKIGRDQDGGLKIYDKKRRTRDLLIQCRKLRQASFPLVWTLALPVGGDDASGSIGGDLFFLLNCIDVERPNLAFREVALKKMEYFDFKDFHSDSLLGSDWDFRKQHIVLQMHWYSSSMFMQICMMAKRSGMKLGNVSPSWFVGRFGRVAEFGGERYTRPDLGTPVYSLMGLDTLVMSLSMPNLEEIRIPGTTRCIVGDRQPEWPKLRVLEICVDGVEGTCWNYAGVKKMDEIHGICIQSTRNLFNFLFLGVKRINLTELSLEFVREGGGVVPKAEMIVESCPNLKRIRLRNWMGKQKGLLVLWGGLDGLEEISLEYCKNVGDVSFVGLDVQKPILFRLKKLKKLTLMGLDQMVKISDRLFSSVLSQMPLKQLILTSDGPIGKQISKVGIMSMCEGPFAESIEKFPFDKWSLANVSAEEFGEMEKQFRSYDMM